MNRPLRPTSTTPHQPALLCRVQLRRSYVIQAHGGALPRMNCYSQPELQTSRVTWEKPILNGKRIKIHGRTMNESAIIYYLSTQETTMLLTGTLDITVFSCNYLTIMGTEYLIAWGMAYRSPSSERHPGCSLSAGFKPELSPPKEKKKKKKHCF